MMGVVFALTAMLVDATAAVCISVVQYQKKDPWNSFGSAGMSRPHCRAELLERVNRGRGSVFYSQHCTPMHAPVHVQCARPFACASQRTLASRLMPQVGRLVLAQATPQCHPLRSTNTPQARYTSRRAHAAALIPIATAPFPTEPNPEAPPCICACRGRHFGMRRRQLNFGLGLTTSPSFLKSDSRGPSRWDRQDNGHMPAAIHTCRIDPLQFAHRP